VEVGNWVHAEQSTGRIIHIPNYKIFMDPLANYSLGFEYIWDEIRVMVTFESNWRKAKGILQEIIGKYSEDLEEDVQRRLHETSRKYMIYYNNLTPIVYTDVTDSGVQLTMRYICEPKMRRFTTEKIWEAVLDAFGAEIDIDIAYPTMRRVQL
jgi:small-conductance mechanosensitive channel